MSSNGTRVTGNCTKKPMLKISKTAWDKMWKLTQEGCKAGNFEVSTIGIVAEDDELFLEDVFIIPQVNTGATTEFKDGELANFTLEMVNKGVDPGRIKVWHHSHANMDVFWSSVDTANIERYDSDGVMWSIVTNGSNKIKIRADIFRPFRYWWDDCPYQVVYDDDSLTNWYNESVENIEYSKPKPLQRVTKYESGTTVYGRHWMSGNTAQGRLTSTSGGSSKGKNKKAEDSDEEYPFALPDLHLSAERKKASEDAAKEPNGHSETSLGVEDTEADYWEHVAYLTEIDKPGLIVTGKFRNDTKINWLPEILQDAYDYGFIDEETAKDIAKTLATRGEMAAIVALDTFIRKEYKEDRVVDSLWYELRDHVLDTVAFADSKVLEPYPLTTNYQEDWYSTFSHDPLNPFWKKNYHG